MDSDLADLSAHSSVIDDALAEPTDDSPELEALRLGRVRLTLRSGLGSDFLFYIRNNHVLFSVCFAHPRHPYSAQRRKATLLNSLAFAVFLTALLLTAAAAGVTTDGSVGLAPDEALADDSTLLAALAGQRWPLSVSTLLQLVWDVSGSMLGVCPCARDLKYPTKLRYGCGYVQLVCMACNLLLGLVYGLIGLGLLLIMGPFFSVYSLEQFATLLVLSKLAAIALALPVSLLIFLLLRCCESPPPDDADSSRGFGDLGASFSSASEVGGSFSAFSCGSAPSPHGSYGRGRYPPVQWAAPPSAGPSCCCPLYTASSLGASGYGAAGSCASLGGGSLGSSFPHSPHYSPRGSPRGGVASSPSSGSFPQSPLYSPRGSAAGAAETTML